MLNQYEFESLFVAIAFYCAVGGVSFYTKPAKYFRIRGHLTYTLSPFVQVNQIVVEFFFPFLYFFLFFFFSSVHFFSFAFNNSNSQFLTICLYSFFFFLSQSNQWQIC
jgi:hypothetical protein